MKYKTIVKSKIIFAYMNKKIKIAIGGIIAVIVIALGTYTISPLFINTKLNPRKISLLLI
jgi:hypothetical protein